MEKKGLSQDFETVCARELLLEITPSIVPVCLDSEVEMIEVPLRYTIRPKRSAKVRMC